MPYLVVASITVPVRKGQGGLSQVERIGSSSRAFAGNLRSSYRAEKRVWQFTTELLELTAWDTLYAAVALGAHVTCSGDALRGTVTCEVEMSQGSDEVAGPNGVMRSATLILREV